MSSLMRFDPFRDVDQLVEQLSRRSTGPRSFPMDAYRRGDEFLIHLDLPGVAADAIDMSVDQNVLTITAERRFESEADDQVIVSERPQGTFTRQLLLGESLDVDAIEASYEDGVLTLRVPVAERAKPRRISVGTSGRGPRTIEGRSETARDAEPGTEEQPAQ
jgi:HSP20 family protein